MSSSGSVLSQSVQLAVVHPTRPTLIQGLVDVSLTKYLVIQPLANPL